MATKPLPLDQMKPTPAGNPPAARPAAAPRAVPGGRQSGRIETVQGGRAIGVREELEEREELGGFSIWLRETLHETPSWLVSMVFHMIVLLVLALWTVTEGKGDDDREIIATQDEEEQLDELDELEDEPLEEIDLSPDAVGFESEMEQPEMNLSPAEDMEMAAYRPLELSEFGLEHAPRDDLLGSIGSYSGTGVDGRGHGKRGLLRKYGGTDASEKAVAAALLWLAKHQLLDGGWSFEHHRAPQCKNQCRNPGKEAKARIAATAMAVLPFLGAGQTHKSGKYKETVKRGLYFLEQNMKISHKGGSLWENGGRMYSHGLASIALCEAFAMTNDKGLHRSAQQAVNFICYAQDPVGGGWRYEPRQKGDTSVVGWQIMALKSGHMAYLTVPPITVKKAFDYLDAVQANSGANYGYTGPGEGPATTAIGLLCRMYLGWKKDNPALQRGVKWISNRGPSKKGNMYYNYYATQVMKHWEGEEWKKWNNVMHDQLVNTQATAGHEKGSWYMKGGDHGSDRGGRLYCTSMATMVLEVYYRHMPIYRSQAVEEDFPE